MFLQKEFTNELKSKLIQAGDLVRSVNLENVFVDLLAEKNNSIYNESSVRISEFLINKGNNLNRSNEGVNKFVIVGGAGAGKSTITQFLTQYYTAHFLKANNKKKITNVENFLKEYKTTKLPTPNCLRFPIKIVLKDYAGWLNDKLEKGEQLSVLQYIKYRINNIADSNINLESLRNLLKKMSFIFIFDGLDEVPVSSNRDKVIKEINDFIDIELNEIQCDSLIVATTRPQGYTKEFNDDIYEHYTLMEMTDDICKEYLDKLLRNIESTPDTIKDYTITLVEALKNEITGRLMRTPLQATIMTILVVSGGEPSINKYQLFKKYYDTIYNREKQKKVSRLINTYETQINQIHNLLGYQLQVDSEISNNAYSNMDIAHFSELINKYLKSESWDDQEIKEFIDDLKNTITHRLVFITEVQDKKVGFVVRSLQEFFAANYYMDKKEEEIKSNILKIATSAYWRNTLIFSVGYLRINKSFLVDDVFRICEELNGLGFSPDDKKIEITIKSGSWLALDILTEGIINDSKKFLYKFVTLLDELLDIPLLDEHTKFSKLDNLLKHDWIVNNFLLNRLNRPKEIESFSTIYEISCIMLSTTIHHSNTNLKNLLFSSVTRKNKLLLLEKLYKFQQIDEKFIELFSELLLEFPIINVEDIINRDLQKYTSFLPALIEKSINNNNKKLIKKIAEVFLLISMNRRYEHENGNYLTNILGKLLVKKINVADPNMLGLPLTHNSFLHKEYVVYNNIKAIIFLTQNKNNNILKMLKDMCVYYEIDYLKLYFEYLITPTITNLLNFFTTLESENIVIKSKFLLFINDWLFYYIIKICNGDYKRESILNCLDSLLIKTDDDILFKEKELIDTNDDGYRLYFSSKREYSLNEPYTVIVKAIQNLGNNPSEIYIDNLCELMAIYGPGNPFNASINVNFDIDHVIELLSKITIDSDYTRQLNFISAWSFLICLGEKKKIYDSLQKYDCFLKLNFQKNNRYFHMFYDDLLLDQFYKNAISILNVFLSFGGNHNVIVLLVSVLLSGGILNTEKIKINLLQINFSNLLSIEYLTTSSRISKFILLLFSITNPWPDTDYALSKFLELAEADSELFQYCISIIHSLKIENLWVIELVVKLLNSELFHSLEDEDCKEQYFAYLKEINEVQKVSIDYIK